MVSRRTEAKSFVRSACVRSASDTKPRVSAAPLRVCISRSNASASLWDSARYAVAIAIINAHAMLESDLAIVDSALPGPIRARLVEKVWDQLAKRPTLTSAHPPVQQGQLGGRAPAMGAALMPMYRRYFSRDAADMGL